MTSSADKTASTPDSGSIATHHRTETASRTGDVSEAGDVTDPLYSIVIPVYRSADILPELVKRLDAFFDRHPYRHEYVFINDGSPDDSWRVLEELQAGRDDVVAIDLLRNYGQHSAVFCGFQHARGQFVITMDDDLQNPPEELIHLIRKIDEGYDVVFGQFHQKMHGLVRILGSKTVGWLNMKLFNKPRDLVLSNFRIIRREVVDAVCDHSTTFPYIPGLVLLCGKSFANVMVDHHPRKVGASNYTIRVIARLLWRIIFNYSAFPLRVLCSMGLVTALVSFILGTYYLIRSLFVATAAPGFPTLVVLFSFYQGIMLAILAALGEYVVRIVNDVSGQRAYRIRRTRQTERADGDK